MQKTSSKTFIPANVQYNWLPRETMYGAQPNKPYSTYHTAPTIQKGHLKLCLQNKSEPVGYMTTPVSIQSVLYVQYINNVITSRIAETTKANGVRIVKKVHHTCIITTTGFTNNTLYIII